MNVLNQKPVKCIHFFIIYILICYIVVVWHFFVISCCVMCERVFPFIYSCARSSWMLDHHQAILENISQNNKDIKNILLDCNKIVLFSIILYFIHRRWLNSWMCWTRNLLNVYISLLYSYRLLYVPINLKRCLYSFTTMLIEYLNLPVETTYFWKKQKSGHKR